MDDNRIPNIGAVNRFGYRGCLTPVRQQVASSHQNNGADITQTADKIADNRKTPFEKRNYSKPVQDDVIQEGSTSACKVNVDGRKSVKLHKRSRNVFSDFGQGTGFSSDEEDTENNSTKDILPRLSNEDEKQTELTEECDENVLGSGEDMAFDELAENVSFRDILLSLEDTSFAPLAVLSVPDKSSKIEDESFPELPNDKCTADY